MSLRALRGLTDDGVDGEGESMRKIWPIVHAERAALIRDLEGLDPVQWEVGSLCAGWTVHDVAIHLADTARTTRLRFVVGMARARFDFDRQNEHVVERERERVASPQQTLAWLRRVARRTSTPPAPLDGPGVEVLAKST